MSDDTTRRDASDADAVMEENTVVTPIEVIPEATSSDETPSDSRNTSEVQAITTSYLVDDPADKTMGLGAHIMRLPSIIKESPRNTAVAAVIALVVLAGGAWGLWTAGIVPGEGTRDTSAVVARVNGVVITEAELNKRVGQVEQTLEAQMGTTSPLSDELRGQVLDELINLELLTQSARGAGYEATDADVDAELARVTELLGGEEQLETQLVLVGLTKEELRENVKNELGIRKYLEASTDVGKAEVSEEELKALYDSQFSDTPDAPSFEEVKPYLQQQAVQEKSGAILQEFIAKLKSEATIENPATE